MVGETTANWRECVRKTIELDPDSVTIYQMEVPYNTTIFKEMKVHGAVGRSGGHLEDQARVGRYAFAELENAGYTVRSAYTAVKNPAKTRFVYTDFCGPAPIWSAWAWLLSRMCRALTFRTSMSSRPYSDKLRQGVLPIYRALTLTQEQCMIRELILQMKLGHVHESILQRQVRYTDSRALCRPGSILRDPGLS
jgi:oxygen-independent coproporphyrinogen-3 oxidase